MSISLNTHEQPSNVIYALDIGIYNVGNKNQVLHSTTTAWCRVDRGIQQFTTFQHDGTSDQSEFQRIEATPLRCGRSIIHLAKAIAEDLNVHKQVALGFEAPMWVPVEREHEAGLKLFKPRFKEEKGHEWYLQAGAAATLKAISLGVMLFSHLAHLVSGLACTTDRAYWQDKTLMLFEAFVAGPYKIDPPSEEIARNAPNEWDALLAALAWSTIHADFCAPRNALPVILHEAGSYPGACLSVWTVIFDAAGMIDAPCLPTDCDIVALSPLNPG